IAKDPAMERRFTLVPIEEPEGEALLAIAQESARSLSFFHHVGLDDPAFVKQAIALSTRYMAGRSQPDKVLSLLDTLGSVLQRSGRKEATDRDLLEFISAKSRIPMENLLVDGTRILQTLPERLDDAIKGQAEAKRRIVQLLARRFVRRDTRRPIASLLLAGPSGVGKTETARRLAEYLFGSADRMVIFDMSEFQEQHAVSRLIGSPPGYTGYEDGGRLTEAFRREPYQMLLLDEIEKAHPKVLGILLQILDEGRVTDSRGFTVAMSQAIVVMTTNLGAEELATPRLGFGNGGDRAQQTDAPVRAKIEKALSPEMANRIDEIVVFSPFSAEELPAVTRHLLERTVHGLRENYGCDITVDDPDAFAAAVVAALAPADRSGGARSIRRWLERRLESLVLERIKQQTSAEPIRVSFEMLNDPSAPKE
ncbi:MAG TPA: AAA family ATPase, partial [bacterium]|nr:AAA family ATPase [bacterium]